MVGLMRIALGLGRLGFIVSFLSRPVLSGFTSAAAILIGASQLKHLLGIKLEHTERVHEIVWEALGRLDEIRLPTLAGSACRHRAAGGAAALAPDVARGAASWSAWPRRR